MQTTPKRIFFILMITCLLSLTLPGANAHATSMTASLFTGTLRVNAGGEPGTIDPHVGSFTNEIGHAKMVYDGLTRMDKDMNTVPAAAESWAFSADGQEITFQLRAGLKYSDGSVLNARRFEYAILRTLDPTVAGEYASILFDISGAKEYNFADPNLPPAQLAALRAAVGVRALDTNNNPCTSYVQTNCLKLRIQLKQAVYHFPTVMSLWVVYPAKEELIQAGGAEWWRDPGNLVGNGPFVAHKLDFTNGSDFWPNPNYILGAPAYRVKFLYIGDISAAIDLYKQGGLDITPVSSDQWNAVKSDPNLNPNFQIYPGGCTFAVMFNNAAAPFTDPKVRAAFAYAFDREAWVRDVLNGLGSPTLTWIPPNMPGYQAGETRWGYNPDKARQALSESTYGSAANLPAITVTFADTPRNRTRWEWLSSKWKEVLGVTVKLNPVPTDTAITNSQMYLLGWCGDYPDPSNYLFAFRENSIYTERIHYANPQFDALLNQADSTQDAATRLALYKQAQDLLVADIPVAFGWNNTNAYLVRENVTGEAATPMDNLWTGDTNPHLITLDNQLLFLPMTQR